MPRAKEWGPVRRFPSEWPPLNPKPLDPTEYPFIPEASISAANLVGDIPPEKLQLRAIKVYLATSNQTIADSTDADITFNTTLFNLGYTDPGASFTTVTIPSAGLYLCTSTIHWAVNSTNTRVHRLQVGGATKEQIAGGAGADTSSVLAAVRRFSQGDTVGIQVWQNAGGPLDVQAGEEDCNLSLVFLGTV